MSINDENSFTDDKDENSINMVDDNEINGGLTVRFNDTVYTNEDTHSNIVQVDNPIEISSNGSLRKRPRRKSGILKRRENTITTADAPRIILSDEGLKAGRVSPFINFRLFLSMTIRSVGIIFGDM